MSQGRSARQVLQRPTGPWSRSEGAHRWLSMAFMAAFIATSIALAQKKPIVWMSYLPLAPLFLLAITGLYMFVLPYLAKRRARKPG